EVYVEREPGLQIPGSGIESVIVGKEKNYGNSPKELERMRRDLEEIIKAKSKMEKRDEKTYPSGFSYKLTFKLKPVDWKREVSFSRNNLEQFFHIKLGNRDFGITLIGPMDDEVSQKNRQFTLYTGEDDPNRIKEILSPLKDKVSWE